MAEMGRMRFTNTNKLAEDLSAYVIKGSISFALPIQRGYVWDKAKKSAFILNMIEGGPTFPIYVNKTDGVDYVIDGQQRLRTTSDFIENKFSLSKLPPVKMSNGEMVKISGEKFNGLPQSLKDAILRYPFDYNFGENLTDKQVKLIFIRLNSGKPLSATEMTMAQIESIDEIKKIAQHSVFKKLLNEKGFEASKNEDIVMQIYIILFEDKVDLIATQIRKILYRKTISLQEQKTILECLTNFEDIFSTLEVDNSYEAQRAKIFLMKKTHLVSFIFLIHQCMLSNKYDIQMLIDWVKYFFAGKIDQTSISEDYNLLLLGGTNKRDSVDKRAKIVHESFLSYADEIQKGE